MNTFIGDLSLTQRLVKLNRLVNSNNPLENDEVLVDLPTGEDLESDRIEAVLSTTLKLENAHIYKFELSFSIPFRIFSRNLDIVETVCDDFDKEYNEWNLNKYRYGMFFNHYVREYYCEEILSCLLYISIPYMIGCKVPEHIESSRAVLRYFIEEEGFGINDRFEPPTISCLLCIYVPGNKGWPINKFTYHDGKKHCILCSHRFNMEEYSSIKMDHEKRLNNMPILNAIAFENNYNTLGDDNNDNDESTDNNESTNDSVDGVDDSIDMDKPNTK